MKSDGSKRDEFPDRKTKRYSGKPHTIIFTPDTYERTWGTHVINFAKIFGTEVICVQDVRMATGYNCHCNSEKKSDTVCIVNGSRYVAVDDFKERSTRLYPRMENHVDGAEFLKWVRGNFTGSKCISHNKPKLFFGKTSKEKQEKTNSVLLKEFASAGSELLQNVSGDDLRKHIVALIEGIAEENS